MKNAQTDLGIEKEPRKKGLGAFRERVFGKFDFRSEEQLGRFGKSILMLVLVLFGVFLLLERLDGVLDSGAWQEFFPLLAALGVLVCCTGVRLFAARYAITKNVLYGLEGLCACVLSLLANGFYPVAFFMVVLTSFYVGHDKMKPSLCALGVALLLYACSYVLKLHIRIGFDFVELFSILRQSFSALFALVVHFVVTRVAFAFYKQFLRLQKALAELDESKKELEKAYSVVAEVTALEERQRIAKEIHDTAGHSITTVIMQTEGAKLMIDGDPEEAKKKIVAANLQAKHALEELRDSVHLLSGVSTGKTLKTALEEIIHESTDGTGLVIRSEIEDFTLSPTKARFLCNTLKEGIANGLRHGGATAFWFEAKKEGDKLKFLLSDNGNGLQGKLPKLGFGLTTMRDRARSLGGEVTFLTTEGFEIRLELPLDK